MAITINVQPTGTITAYNDMIYVVSSDNTSQPNFSYIADIYIGTSVTPVHRMKVPPHPSFGSGVFNPSRIAESYVSKNFDLDLTGVTQCADSINILQLKFGEEYGVSSSGTTVYTDLAASELRVFYNGVLDWEEFVDYNSAGFRSGDSSKRFLTNCPNNKKVLTNNNEYLYAINRTSGDIYFFEVITMDSSLNPLGIYRINNSYQSVANVEDRMVRCPAGWNLNDIDAANITIVGGTYGALPIMISSVYSYTIKCIKYSGSATMETRTYYTDSNCDRFTHYKIHFLNKLGGYDSYTFTKKNSNISGINRSEYKKNLGELTSGSTYLNSKSQRAITQFNTVIEDTVTVKSDYLSSGDIAWLEELVTSPDVYLEKDGSAIPINLTNASFERHNGEDKKLFNLSIDFKYSYKRNRQRF
jgi:hypothetical protein